MSADLPTGVGAIVLAHTDRGECGGERIHWTRHPETGMWLGVCSLGTKHEMPGDVLRDPAVIRPGRIREPEGWGAVVRFSDGTLASRTNDGQDYPWIDNEGSSFAWKSPDVIEVLFEGVTR